MMLKIRTLTSRAVCLALVASVMAVTQTGAAENPVSSKEKERKLIQILESDALPQDKAIPCKELAIYGTKDAFPALGALLCDANLSSWARIALEAIPDSAAD